MEFILSLHATTEFSLGLFFHHNFNKHPLFFHSFASLNACKIKPLNKKVYENKFLLEI